MFLYQGATFVPCEWTENNNFDFLIPKRYLNEILLRYIFNFWCKFNNEFQNQTDGVAIGLSISPFLVEYFMATLENTVLQLTIDGFQSYKKYTMALLLFLLKTIISMSSWMNLTLTIRKLNLHWNQNWIENFVWCLRKRRPDGTSQRSIYLKPTWNG